MTPSTLVESARKLLEGGPTHTLDLAHRVLGLQGHAGAAAEAVFTLLGSDPRFRVDGAGVWTLDVAASSNSLASLEFAVVDVETTGLPWGRGGRMTEIAVVHVQGGCVRDSWSTLLNPEWPIPYRIQRFTGITDEMVAAAPLFEGVAPLVAERLAGRVFVAHNVRFDWSFVRRELLDATGDAPGGSRLCTARVGRLLVPGLESYGLDSLTTHFGIPIHGRHRALGDAVATAHLLLRLLGEAEERGIRDLPSLRTALGPGRRRRRRRDREAYAPRENHPEQETLFPDGEDAPAERASEAERSS